MNPLAILRRPTEPLPPGRPTLEILSDIDRQVGRLQLKREEAVALIRRMEEADDADAG